MIGRALHSVTRSAARRAFFLVFFTVLSVDFFRFGAPLAFRSDFIQFVVGQAFDADEGVVYRTHSP